MLSFNDNVSAALMGGFREILIRLYDTNGNMLVKADGEPYEIKNLTIKRGICGDGDFSLGNTFVPQAQVVLDGGNSAIPTNKFDIRMGIRVEDLTMDFSSSLGIFYVTSVKGSTYETTIEAQGLLGSLLDNDLANPSLKTPSMQNLINRVSANFTSNGGTALLVDDSLVKNTEHRSAINISANLTVRSALSILSQTVGCYCTEITNNNTPVLRKYRNYDPNTDSIVRVIDSDLYQEPPTINSSLSKISSIKVTRVKESSGKQKVYTKGSAPYVVEADNKYMSGDLFRDYTANIVGFEYQPCEVDMILGDPRIEPYDFVKVVDVDGAEFVLPVMYVEHSYDGGLTTRISTPPISDTLSGGVGSTDGDYASSNLSNVSTEDFFAVLNTGKVNAQTVDTDFLKGTVVSAINLSTEDAVINSAHIGDLDASKITSGYINADRLKASVVDAINAYIGDAVIDSAHIGEINADMIKGGTIDTDILESNIINAINITSGTIDVSRLIYTNPDGTKSLVSFDANGLPQATKIPANQMLEPLTITADLIKSGEISADKLNVGQYMQFISDAVDENGENISMIIVGGESNSPFRVAVSGRGIEFFEGGSVDDIKGGKALAYRVAYIKDGTLKIGKTVSLQDMQVGEQKWSWKHNTQDEAIYLKWIGESK